jgi:hypothetical protein
MSARPCALAPVRCGARLSALGSGHVIFGGGTVWRVRVQASPEAVQLIEEQGGKLYVWAKRSRCCHGSLTFLETSNEPAERSYRLVSADEIELYLDERLGDPEELVIEAGGRRRKHVHAYWDGCAYVV